MSEDPKPLSTWEFLLARALSAGNHDEAARMVKKIAKEEASDRAGNVAILLIVFAAMILWIISPAWLR